MTKYLISFPSAAMDHVPDEDWPKVSEASHEVVREAKKAGVWVFGGGINAEVPSVLVGPDGRTSSDASRLDGGFAVLELPDRQAAIEWAAKIAVACRCPQHLREFHYDPES